ncbi:MAG: caspase family protein, partial [Chloroflexota bacterium]|nr:caspase family protein [Chloroflexota bacterium]
DTAIEQWERRHFPVASFTGNTVLLAACRADQTAADAPCGPGYHGAFTYHLANTLATGEQLSYTSVAARLRALLAADGFAQEPQLECDPALQNRPFLAGPIA